MDAAAAEEMKMSKPITAPRPPVIPRPKPRRIHDAASARRERELDAMIERCAPTPTTLRSAPVRLD